MAGYGAAVPSSRAKPLGMVNQPPSKVSGLLYGLGLGGFIDGIVLHQILQWHHMVSDVSRYPVTWSTCQPVGSPRCTSLTQPSKSAGSWPGAG